MTSPEKIEKTRQAIMRFRELLDILTRELATAEEAYKQLFVNFTPEEMATLKEKELQRLVATSIVDNPSFLADAALHMRFVSRNLERDFEQLYDNVMAEEEEEE
jgi:hypothetical protein